jgi:hypothetical protein
MLGILALLTSCSDDTTEPQNGGGGLTGTESGFEVLGAGYDVFDNYADPLEVKATLLDRAAMRNDGLFEERPYERSTFYTATGTTIQEYAYSLNHSTQISGSYSFFSASVGVNFSENRYTHTRYSFATVQSLIKKYGLRVKLDVTADQLKPYLTETANNNLNSDKVTPEELFQMYGTHVVTGLIVGGRLDYSVSADMTQVDESTRIGLYAEASFKSGFASAELQTSTEIEENMSSFNETMEKRLEVYGGQSEYGQNIVNDDDYRAWIESVSENPVFCDFEESGLVPIWELCDDQNRSDAIASAFATWANDHDIPMGGPYDCLVDLQVHITGNPAPELPGGYKLLPQDLNDGAGGAFIWIYYKLGPDDGTEGDPITGIYTVDTSNGESNPPGGTMIGVDLNYDVGGDFIYLGYFRGTGDAVRSIATHNPSDGDYNYSQGGASSYYYWVTHQGSATLQDLNEGAGGDFIYVGYSYDYLE